MRKDTVHSVTCPHTVKMRTNRQNVHDWTHSKEWYAFRDTHARVPGARCERCHRTHGQHKIDKNGNPKFNKKTHKPLLVYLTINHINRLKYRSKEEYLTWDDDCEICCNDCNGMAEKGLKPCPDCRDDGIIRYINWQQSMCRMCYDKLHPEEAAKRKADVKSKQDQKKALLKRLRADQISKVNKWKEDHPLRKSKNNLNTFLENPRHDTDHDNHHNTNDTEVDFVAVNFF